MDLEGSYQTQELPDPELSGWSGIEGKGQLSGMLEGSLPIEESL